ncbi:MAG: hypothetical protein Q7U54_01055 [Bacteroidales bacterium]|nr:hypothetical protein [Bacteroidales bacterium]
MNTKTIYLGNTIVNSEIQDVKGEFIEIENEKFYKISNCNQMPDFFMTIVSDSDHWMFISSNGSLTAGRKDRNNALFPYYTVDKIHDSRGITGSQTYLLVGKADKTYLWEPFSSESEKIYTIERNLYKSIYGNKIIFEEINIDLGIGFRYGWYSSEKFGFVKKSIISNHNTGSVSVDVLDGIKNILPNGVDFDFQNAFSSLLDAYKKCELLEETKLGLYMLSSIPVDRAEPSESLKATTVWSSGLNQDTKILISNHQVENFVKGLPVETETDIRATRGAYFVCASLKLDKDASKDWLIVAEINQESSDVANLSNAIKTTDNIKLFVDTDIEKGTSNLIKIVGNADGLQVGNDGLSCTRHFSNTLFNVMRGGIFTNNYILDKTDFVLFVGQINTDITAKYNVWLDQLPETFSYMELAALAEKTADQDLIRIGSEYLPLTFSRRHGDPSRPWNQFSIETKNPNGSAKLNYQGNWRDIFQNWEALGLSYPEFLEGMMSKFLNATTADGYNPYRVTREGIDWESPDPHDPWAYIGYWGDHQIIYLQKFLELSDEFHPGTLDSLLKKEMFVYANVPYRIKSYPEIVKNPKDTIVFDFALNDEIRELTRKTGADGVLLKGSNNEIYKVNLTEKILVTLLAKLSNFIPEAGIWLNTQRPEWNDANNALVGNGVSMVTLCYLRRFLKFWSEKFNESACDEISVSEEVGIFFDKIFTLFSENTALIGTGFSDADRRRFADSLGEAGSDYRNSVYSISFSGRKMMVQVKALAEFTQLALGYMDQSIRVNKREDGLYHAYNLVSFSDHGVSIRHLYEMLEGQVAVLSSGYLSVQESLDVLNALKASRLFRKDQYSYLLYPDRQLPLFSQKNNIPGSKVKESKLLSKLVADSDSSILSKDDLGNYHFNGTFRNAGVLEKALNQLDSTKYAHLVAEEKEKVLAVFEELFDHQSFTGRSGTFYGYEGLGSIYWHMVSKLLLAAQECYFKGVYEGADPVAIGKIKDHYFEIKAGIGLNKSPQLYGAFPTDAYSHTPGNAGAQQPGMTGQVKEDFISRMRELGIHIQNGEIVFQSSLLNPDELLSQKSIFEFFNLKGELQQLTLEKGQLGFTFCQVPIVYIASNEDKTCVTYADGKQIFKTGHSIGKEISSILFQRTGEIVEIEVSFRDLLSN